MSKQLLAIFAVWVLALPAEATTVTTGGGQISGLEEQGVHVFKGIPYASAPVGKLRWQAPQPLSLSEKIIDASSYGPYCLQRLWPDLPRSGMSEDCLTLNIWTPGINDGKRPVMVNIHGGGLRAGSGKIHGNTLATQGAVVVSFNYRLGALGFFGHEALGDSPANPGLLDMLAALSWVQKHISDFGGDPSNVTIFGVSAGGMSVKLLMSLDESEGLFHRAIGQSGYATWPLPRTSSAPLPAPSGRPNAEKMAHKLVAKVTTAKQTRELLYSLDGQALNQAIDGFYLPVVDGRSLPEEPAIRFLRGEQQDIPFITGGNSFEGSVKPYSGFSDEAYRTMLGPALQGARELYHSDPDDVWLARMWGDHRYLLSAKVTGSSMAKLRSPVWLYYIDFLPESARGAPGATHGSDFRALFEGHLVPDPATREMSLLLQKFWLNFARYGNPNGLVKNGTDFTWQAHTPENDSWLLVNEQVSMRSGVIADKLKLLEDFYLRGVRDAL